MAHALKSLSLRRLGDNDKAAIEIKMARKYAAMMHKYHADGSIDGRSVKLESYHTDLAAEIFVREAQRLAEQK